jgi:GT2 family glycosyltransferase
MWSPAARDRGRRSLGFSRAIASAFATPGEYVLLMNPDTVAPPGAIQTLVRSLASSRCGDAGARLRSGSFRAAWGRRLARGANSGGRFSRAYHRKVRAIAQVRQAEPAGREVPWVSGPAWSSAAPTSEAVSPRRTHKYTEDVT